VLCTLLFLLHESTQALSDLIPHFSEHRELPIRRGRSRVFKAMMKSLRAPWKYRARFLCVIADGEDIVELLAREFIHRLRAASGDVDSELSHCRNSIRIETSRTSARAEYLELIPGDMSQQTLGHLAASRITRAKEKDSLML
jgi:hypothetical protein